MRLQEMMDRQAAIKDELQRMDNDPTVTEEDHADIRDTLIGEFEELEDKKQPVLDRMEKIKLIKKQATTPGAQEPGNGEATRWNGGGDTPEFMTRLDPFADLDKVREGLVRGSDMVARSMQVIEQHNKRGLLLDERAEEATRKASADPMVARHMLTTGYPEYIEAFRAYVNDPMGEGLRSAQRSLTLGTASGGYLLPYVLDQVAVA